MYRASLRGPSHPPILARATCAFRHRLRHPSPSVSNAVGSLAASGYASATASAVASASAPSPQRRRARQSLRRRLHSHRLSLQLASRTARVSLEAHARLRVHREVFQRGGEFHRDARPRPVPASRRPREHARVASVAERGEGARRRHGKTKRRARRRGNRGGGGLREAVRRRERRATVRRSRAHHDGVRGKFDHRIVPHARRPRRPRPRRVRLFHARRPALRDEDRVSRGWSNERVGGKSPSGREKRVGVRPVEERVAERLADVTVARRTDRDDVRNLASSIAAKSPRARPDVALWIHPTETRRGGRSRGGVLRTAAARAAPAEIPNSSVCRGNDRDAVDGGVRDRRERRDAPRDARRSRVGGDAPPSPPIRGAVVVVRDSIRRARSRGGRRARGHDDSAHVDAADRRARSTMGHPSSRGARDGGRRRGVARTPNTSSSAKIRIGGSPPLPRPSAPGSRPPVVRLHRASAPERFGGRVAPIRERRARTPRTRTSDASRAATPRARTRSRVENGSTRKIGVRVVEVNRGQPRSGTRTRARRRSRRTAATPSALARKSSPQGGGLPSAAAA